VQSLCQLSLNIHPSIGLDLDEDGVRIGLTIVDTPGFGDNIDNEFAYVYFIRHRRFLTYREQFPRDCWTP
jgi:septin family protein